jgi:hypothetical protein
MDLNKWYIDTPSIEAELDRAKQYNERVRGLAVALQDAPDHVLEAALDALERPAASHKPSKPSKPSKPRKRRATQAEMKTIAEAIFRCLDDNGKTASQLADEVGDIWNKNVLTKMVRDGLARVVGRGLYARP